MKRISFELHIDDSKLAKLRIIALIIEVVELLNSDFTSGSREETYAVMQIIDSKPSMLFECQSNVPAAAPFLRVYCDPTRKPFIQKLLKGMKLNLDTEWVPMTADAATDMIPEGSFNDDDVTPNDRERDG